MQPRSYENGLKIFIVLLLWKISPGKSYHHHKQSSLDVLNRLLQGNSPPVVIYLTGGKQQQAYDFDELDSRSASLYDDDGDSVERDSYLLYNLVKAAQDKEDLDSSAENQFENTKDILRTAVRSRCAKRDNCVQQCPPKKPACEHNCQKVFDALNACEETTTTCEPKTTTRGCRGKTMPPKWLRMLRALVDNQ